uniref:Plasmid replication protein origin binding domain-containing protein n=1 Tax=uncultured prokaryote TaxID=198431 RepID=A0A0H5Q9N3_9ZZZZ|nr:hypothetical protein [uncultured prokaryote]
MSKAESGARINKARYWWAVLYPENMVPDWENRIGDIVQVPYAYAAHTLDKDSKSEHRKDHVHLILVFGNTTTYKHAMEVFNLLSAPGKKALNTCEACVNIRHCYDYLIHDTETCRKEGKHQYDPDHRVTGNNFDIGAYEALSQAEKAEMSQEIAALIIGKKITNLADCYIIVMDQFGGDYFQVFQANNAFYDRLCRGNYLKYSEMAESEPPQSGGDAQEHEIGSQHHENHPIRDTEERINRESFNDFDSSRDTEGHVRDTEGHAPTCPFCDSLRIKKKGKTASGQQRYQCIECGKTSTTMF